MEELNFDLAPRREQTRDCSNSVVKFELSEITQHYNESVDAIKNQCIVASQLFEQGHTEQGENIWRAQIVFLESTFDFFLHEITKYILDKMFNGEREPTEKYGEIKVEMDVVARVLRGEVDSRWFLDYINRYYSDITMVSFKSFKKQMNLLGINIRNVADCAFYLRGASEKTMDKLKRRLNDLYRRRNIIAHQFDREHCDANQREISSDTVESFINDINSVVQAITTQITNS